MFIFGNTVDCNHWHEDYTNCLKWKNNKDKKAAVIYIVFILYLFELIYFICFIKETLILSEKNKRILRWKSYYDNDVWENRDSPPNNWNVPLPDFIAQRRSNSTLKDSLDKNILEENKSLCSIM